MLQPQFNRMMNRAFYGSLIACVGIPIIADKINRMPEPEPAIITTTLEMPKPIPNQFVLGSDMLQVAKSELKTDTVALKEINWLNLAKKASKIR